MSSLIDDQIEGGDVLVSGGVFSASGLVNQQNHNAYAAHPNQNYIER